MKNLLATILMATLLSSASTDIHGVLQNAFSTMPTKYDQKTPTDFCSDFPCLAKYIDGGAAAYFDAGVKRVAISTIKNNANNEITTYVYEFSTESQAETFYQKVDTSKPISLKICQKGRIDEGFIVGLKGEILCGKYYVESISDKKYEGAIDDMKSLLTVIGSRINKLK